MSCLLKFYLPSGARHPNETELQQKPLARLISQCIENNREFSGKRVEAGFTYPSGGSKGRFSLTVEWDVEKIPEGSISAGEADVWDAEISVCNFESASVSSELTTSVKVFFSRCAEVISGWLI
jgi:hypothetical protein